MEIFKYFYICPVSFMLPSGLSLYITLMSGRIFNVIINVTSYDLNVPWYDCNVFCLNKSYYYYWLHHGEKSGHAYMNIRKFGPVLPTDPQSIVSKGASPRASNRRDEATYREQSYKKMPRVHRQYLNFPVKHQKLFNFSYF